MGTLAENRIICPVGYAIGRELEEDGWLDEVERFEMGFLQGLAAVIAAPEWAMAQLQQVEDWEGWVETMRAEIAAHPVG